MSLWAYVPGRVFERIVAGLPSAARRLDTGEWTSNVELWANACGYWDTGSPTVAADLRAAKNLTDDEYDAVVAAFAEARDKATGRRGYVTSLAQQWASAKGNFHDWLDEVPPYEVPDNGGMPTGPDTLATLKSQVLWMYGRLDPRQQYIYQHERRLTDVLIPLGDFVFTLAQALLDEIERSETFTPPVGWLIE